MNNFTIIYKHYIVNLTRQKKPAPQPEYNLYLKTKKAMITNSHIKVPENYFNAIIIRMTIFIKTKLRKSEEY